MDSCDAPKEEWSKHIKDPLGTPKSRSEMKWAIENNYVIPAFRDGIITVDKMLDHVDVMLEWYTPSKYAIKFMIFIRLVLGEEPENSNPLTHYFFVDSIFQSENVKDFFTVRNIDFNELSSETVILCSREFSKTTIVTYMLFFMAAEGQIPGFGPVNYGLYVSDSMRNGVKKMMLRLRGVYNESLYLQTLFEDVNITQEEAIFVRKPTTKREVALYNEFVVKQKKDPINVPGRMKRTFKVDGLGCATSSRGASNVLTRPQFVFIDDVVANEADASSTTILDSIESTIESDIRGGLSGSGYFIVAIGTPFNKKDPIYRRIEQGSMLPVVFPRASHMPTNDLKEKDFESVWPDRHTYKNCRREYVKAKKEEDNGVPIKMRKLMQEHYLRIANDADRMVTDQMIQWFNRTSIIENAWQYNWYMTTDYTSTGSKGSDYSGAALWAVGSNGDMFLIDLVLRKMELEVQYNETFTLVNQYADRHRGVTVGIEIDGQQNIHLLALKDRMVDRNEYFTFARQKGDVKAGSVGIRSRLEGGNKHWRFRMMLPMFQNNKIWFANELKTTPDMVELLEEIKYTTYDAITSQHDDGIDILSQLNMMEINYPAKNMDGRGIGMTTKDADGKKWQPWGRKQDENEEAINMYNSY